MKWQDPVIEVTALLGKVPDWYSLTYGQCVSFCERVHNLPTNEAKRDFWIRLSHIDKEIAADIRRYYHETIHKKGQSRLPEDLP